MGTADDTPGADWGGDRFVKVGRFSRVFTVVAIVERPGRPVHTVLTTDPGASNEAITLAPANPAPNGGWQMGAP